MSNLDGTNFYGHDSVENIVEQNMIDFVKYGLLELGAFLNIEKDQLDAYGNDESLLTAVSGGSIEPYTIYRGKKPDWCWESNITTKDASTQQPLVPSGLFYNDTFYATGTTIGGTGFYLDFSRGQVVFDQQLPSDVEIKVPRAERHILIYPEDSYDYRNIKRDWYESVQGSGIRTDLTNYAYLPFVTIGINSIRTIKGYALGNRTKESNFEIEFNVFSSNAYERKQISNLFYMLEEKTFKLFDTNDIEKPLNYRGELVNQQADWKFNTENYTYDLQYGRFRPNAQTIKIKNDIFPIHHGRVIIGLEVATYPL